MVRAKLDYVTLGPFTKGTRLPELRGSANIVQPFKSNARTRLLTVHDPVRDDVLALSRVMGDSLVMALEVAVDLHPPKDSDHDKIKFTLEQTFLAVAARFRPEDQALWDHSTRGAVQAKNDKVKPLERRLAKVGEQVIYGGRGDFMQAKLYLKTQDHGAELQPEEQCVRMEITLRRWACQTVGINHIQDLLNFPYRSKFATHFRLIDHPELRGENKLSAEERQRRMQRMLRAWSTAGVGKFAIGERPREDYLESAQKRVKARARAQLPADEYKLLRDQRANAKIGAALMNLQRRMSA